MDPADYVLVPSRGRRTYLVFDAPLEVNVPWASGPEMTRANIVRQTGPHELPRVQVEFEVVEPKIQVIVGRALEIAIEW